MYMYICMYLLFRFWSTDLLAARSNAWHGIGMGPITTAITITCIIVRVIGIIV